MPYATLQYCTLADLQNRLSDDGVNLRVDDKPTVTTAVINRATTKLDGYLRPRYDPVTQLAASAWVTEACATVAAYYLCGRRANPVPATLRRDFEDLINPDGKSGELQLIRRDQMNLPDVPMRKVEVPVLSQPRIRLDPFPRTVIERNRSTGQAQGYTQHADRLDFFDYSI
jgi:phage gp36-like protein